MRILFVTAILATIVGISTAASPPAVVPAEAAAVEHCQYVDTFVGTSSLYGVFAAKGTAKARAQVLKMAAAAGATHIVWLETPQGAGSTQASAKAYKCHDQRPAAAP